MLEYTKSSTLDTLDFIKETIYYSNLVIQLFYITYLGFRVYNQIGIQTTNIILLVITMFYLFYYIIKSKEFYTKEELESKIFVKNVVKIIKRLIYVYLIVVAVSQLYYDPTSNDNMVMLMTVLMILGFMFSILLDMMLVLIDNKIEIIRDSISYDVEHFRKERKLKSNVIELWMKGVNLDLTKLFPKIEDERKIDKIKKINHKQNDKAMRKRDFDRLNKD